MSNAIASKGFLGSSIALATQGILDIPDAPPVFICLHGRLVAIPTLGGQLEELPVLGGGLVAIGSLAGTLEEIAMLGGGLAAVPDLGGEIEEVCP